MVYPVEAGDHVPVEVYMAHTDVVFPDERGTASPGWRRGRIYCPGVGDDTACLVKSPAGRKVYYTGHVGSPGWKGTEGGRMPRWTGAGMQPGEEGLGNLKGVGAKDPPGLVAAGWFPSAPLTAAWTVLWTALLAPSGSGYA